MYHEAAKNSWERFYGFNPFRNRFFLNPWVHPEFYKNCGSCGGSTVPVVKLNRVREVLGIRFHLICQSLGKMCNVAHFSIRLRCKIKSIAWFLKWNFWNDPQFLKNVTPHKKKPPWPPKKVKMRSPKKSLSSNPPWHVHFAKNQVQFGIFWPLEPHFWSTPPL